MDFLPLNIELVRQKPASKDCLRCCAYMVMGFYDPSIEKNYVWDNIHVYKKHSGLSGGYLVDFGKLVLKNDYSSEITHYATHQWNEKAIESVNKGKKALISSLKDLKKHKNTWASKKEVQKEINYLDMGGKFKVNLPKLENIDYHISRKNPVVVCVNADSFYKTPGEDYTHFIVVVGKKENDYIIRDPYLALDTINKDELYYSWVRNGGWMIAIKPKKEKIKVNQATLAF